MIRDRLLAALREGAFAASFCLPALLFLIPALPTLPALSGWLTLACGLAPVITGLRIAIVSHPSPDHAKWGLTRRGTGCALCQSMRFWWPCAALPLGLTAASLSNIWGLFALGLAITAIHTFTALSALVQGHEPHWNRATGFYVVRL